MKRYIALISVVWFLLNTLPAIGYSVIADTGDNAEAKTELRYEDTFREGLARPQKAIDVGAESFSSQKSDAVLETFEGKTVVNIAENSSAVWEFEVEEPGYYSIRINYFTEEGRGDIVETALEINGKLPFEDCKKIEFTKTYRDELPIKHDNRGNDIRPNSSHVPRWQKSFITDPKGYVSQPLMFEFKAGKNTIRLTAGKDSLRIDKIELLQFEEAPDYKSYLMKNRGRNNSVGYYKEIEAETPSQKSSPMIFAVNDKTSPLMQPCSNAQIKLNALGGATWNQLGQWVEYRFKVDEPGFYNIAIKVKQNMARGMKCYRRILIDNQLPFKELDSVGFGFSTKWKQYVLGGKTPYYNIHLDKGEHTIRIENVLGEYAPLIKQAEETVRELNRAYQKAVMYMGATPDIYRDYMIEKNLKDVVATFKEQAEKLETLLEDMVKLTGSRGDKSAIISRLRYQLNSLVKKPETLPRRMDNLKSNIGALSALIVDLRNQPLLLDYITVYSPKTGLKKAEAGFFQNIWHEAKNFFATFIVDYSMIGNIYEGQETLKVWVTTGRDQANIIKRLVDDSFSRDNKTGVNLQLVQSGMILPAVAGGIKSDVILQMANTEPVNFGMRGAVYDISTFPDCDKILKRFSESAITPLRYNGGVYGLPETENFPMMFYRTDIMSDLGLEVPQTWEDLIIIISELEKSNMYFGLQQGAGAYGIILYQNNGSFYKERSYLNNLTTEEAIKAFQEWTGLYVNYKIPLQFDFVTRFRVGEMPLAIVDFGMFNNLQVTAPEIRGDWDFAPVPGTVREDGTIDRSVMSSGTAIMMMASTENPEKSWEFMKWWTSDETQLRYGRELEAILGTSARYPTANLNAFKNLPWSLNDYNKITSQRGHAKGMPSIPGGYFIHRHLENAFRKTVYSKTNPRETLLDYARIIDEEIKIKCKEFKLDVNNRVA